MQQTAQGKDLEEFRSGLERSWSKETKYMAILQVNQKEAAKELRFEATEKQFCKQLEVRWVRSKQIHVLEW